MGLAPSSYGFLNIKKPAGKTAHDVVAAVRKILRIKQVGHGGTLDPMAEGVLPIAVGKATRLLRFLDGRKTYLAEIRLGQRTTTDDIEGETLSTNDVSSLPPEQEIIAALDRFRGPITQLPPMYSAVHVDGKRLYQLAREGKTVENIPERHVEVFSLDVLSYEAPVLKVRISCAAGTYIRSIARDLGDVLSCGGCLQSLWREQAGPFELAQSVSLESLKTAADNNELEQLLVKPQDILPLPHLSINQEQAKKLSMGQAVRFETAPRFGTQNSEHVLALLDNRLVAVCRNNAFDEAINGEDSANSIQPEVVLLQE